MAVQKNNLSLIGSKVHKEQGRHLDRLLMLTVTLNNKFVQASLLRLQVRHRQRTLWSDPLNIFTNLLLIELILVAKNRRPQNDHGGLLRIIQDQFSSIQNFQRSPFSQTRNYQKTFFVSVLFWSKQLLFYNCYSVECATLKSYKCWRQLSIIYLSPGSSESNP